MLSRRAQPDDAAAIAAIYNEGIEDRVATFETRPRSAADIATWFDGTHPVVVVENETSILAFASCSAYRTRACYAGIAEFSVYVARAERGKGIGRLAIQALIDEAGAKGFWKLVSRIFPENQASLRLLQRTGFREVGLYEKHGKLDGVWRDVVIMELLLRENLR